MAHAEFDDTPIVDGGFFVLMGNDEYLLRLIAVLGWMAAGVALISTVAPGSDARSTRRRRSATTT